MFNRNHANCKFLVRQRQTYIDINESKQPLLDSDDIMCEKKFLHLLLTDVCQCSMIQQ